MQNKKIIKDIPKVARKEISFALYNYKNLSALIENRKNTIRERLNYSTSAWLKGRNQDSNSLEDILTMYEEDEYIKRIKKWKIIINKLLNEFINEEYPVEYYLVKYKYIDNMSDNFLIEKLNLDSKEELQHLIMEIKEKIYNYALKENLYKEVIGDGKMSNYSYC